MVTCTHSLLLTLLSRACSQLASGAASHKTLQDEHPLLRFYYTFPYALFTVCLLNETCLLSFFLLKHEDAVESFM